jgi:hypothetical protein
MLFFLKSVAAAVFLEPARIVMLLARVDSEPAPSLSGVLVYYNLVDAIVRPSTSTL